MLLSLITPKGEERSESSADPQLHFHLHNCISNDRDVQEMEVSKRLDASESVQLTFINDICTCAVKAQETDNV